MSISQDSWMRGDGLFETVRVQNGRPYFLKRHLERFAGSINRFRFPEIASSTIEDALRELLVGINDEIHKLRITLYRDCEFFITLSTVGNKPETLRLAIDLDPIAYDPVSSGSKNSSYFAHLQRRANAQSAGYDDALLINDQGDLVETSLANALMEIDGKLVTPPLTNGALPGITRQIFLDWFPEIIEESVHQSSLDRLTGAATLSSIHGLIPISEITGHFFGISDRLRDLSRDFEVRAQQEPNY